MAGKAVQYFGKDLEAMSFAVNYHRWILDCFRPYLRGSVAEVGAGRGSFSTLLLGTPIEKLVAFEPSDNMFPHLARAIEQDRRALAVQDFFRGAAEPGPYDAVLYVNVLEHIEDDAGEIARAQVALKPDGHLLVFVPALPWLYSELDRQVGHFRRYLKHDLVGLAEQAGLRAIRAHYFDIAGILPWYVNFVLLRNSIGGASVSAYDRLVVPLMRRVERLLPPFVGKNIVLVARKA
jgi:SAM-dependent methyltransferase